MPVIWRFVYFRVDQNSHLAEDIVADTMLALVDAATADTQINHPLPWLRTVANRRIQDHFRAVARVQKLIDQAEQKSVDESQLDPAKQHDQKLQQQAVRDAMAELAEDQQLALELKYIDRMSVKDMTKRMGTTEKAVESILYRARGALRKQLQRGDIAGRDSTSAECTETRKSLSEGIKPMLFSTRLSGES